MQKALNIYITRYIHTVDEENESKKKAKIKQPERKEKSLRKA